MRVLLIDDQRDNSHCEDATVIVRNYEEAIRQLDCNGPWDKVYLDHDLGEDKTGYDIICWLELQKEIDKDHIDFYNYYILPKEIVCVSANPVGRKKIEEVIKKLYTKEYETD